MTTATLELYNALIEAGVEKSKAEAAAKAVITRSEAREFATKGDLKDLEIKLYKALAAQTIVVVGTVVGLLQIL